MRAKALVGRLAVGCMAILTLSFLPLTAAGSASALEASEPSSALAAPEPVWAQVNLVDSGLKNGLGSSTWQAKKKKHHRAKIANPDILPQPLVEIIPGSTINLLSRSSKLPIVIKNDYDNEVRVRVRVQPSNLKVLIPSVIEVVVPANTTVTAKVPVNAIADGPVVLHATLESFSGIRLTVPVDIQMNVILGVEDTVLYGFAGFVTLLAGFGVFRTLRKRRRVATDSSSIESKADELVEPKESAR